MKSAEQKLKKQAGTVGCNCPDPCANQPGGTMFFCEDGVMTPIPLPTGANGTIFVPTIIIGTNANEPFFAKLSDLLNAIIAPPPPGMALADHVARFVSAPKRAKKKRK